MSYAEQLKSKRAWWVLAVPILLAAGAAAVVPSLTKENPAAAAPAPGISINRVDEVDSTVSADAQGLSQAFRDASKLAQPAVVMIQKSANVPVKMEGKGPPMNDMFKGSPFGRGFGDIPELKRFFEQMPRTPSPRQQGMGTGVIVHESGIILTNNHVVQGGGKVVVRLHDGREYEAVEVKTDPQTDLAVIRIEGAEDLTSAKLGDSDIMDIGDWVIALGHPFGLEGTVTAGIISAKGRGIGITAREDFLQTDAAINPGNSGGPLVNLQGQVIGINTAISSRTGGNDGVGFAIPINLAKWVAEQLISDGSVHRAHLGVVIQPVTHELSKQFDVKVREGVLVSQVQDDSPAAAAGVQVGDVIVEFAGRAVTNPRDLQMLVERSPIDVAKPLVVIRDGERKTLHVKCGEHTDDEVAAVEGGEKSRREEMGLELSDLTPEVAKRLGMKDVQGVVITAVEPGSPAGQAGLSSGDVVVQVNRQPVKSVSDFKKVLKESSSDDGTLLLVRTQRGSRFVVIPPMS
jgi:serine protease Do